MFRQSQISIEACGDGAADATREDSTLGRSAAETTTPVSFNHCPLAEAELDEQDKHIISTTRSRTRKRAKTTDVSGKKSLNLLPTMPLDILYEILSHLSPKDILSVSRASRVFRETLMSRGATSVWKAARDRVGAPDCPSWMSEPAWAALLFGHVCQSCGTSNVHKVDFLLLKRVCLSCKKKHLLIRFKAGRRYPGILDLVPSTNVSAWFHGAGNSNYYWDTDLEAMFQKLSKLEADVKKGIPDLPNVVFDFKEEQKQRVAHIKLMAIEWRSWSFALQHDRYNVKRDAQDKRLEQIKQKFRGLGYDDADLFSLRSRKECCSVAPLTTQGWNRIRLKLEPQVVEEKAARLRSEALVLRRNRKLLFHQRYKEYKRTLHPSQWKSLPSTLEILGYETFDSHISAPVEVQVTSEMFDDAFSELPGLVDDARKELKRTLRDLLPDDAWAHTAAGGDPMNLITAAFRCENDSAIVFGWNEIVSHCCENYEGILPEMEATPRFSYSGESVAVVRKVAEVVGLDCIPLSPSEMDECTCRFSCDSCLPYEVKGFMMMVRESYESGYDWRSLMDHFLQFDFHNVDLNMTILSSQKAEEVRQCKRVDKDLDMPCALA